MPRKAVYRRPWVRTPFRRQRRRFSRTITAPLVAGVASFVSSGPAVINVLATAATGGAAPITVQWQRNANGGAYSNLSGATSLTLADTTVSLGVLYGYKLVYTDAIANTVTSNAVTAQAYAGGVIGASGTFPGAGDVRQGVVFGPSDNLTGRLIVPAVNQVISGIPVDDSDLILSGTYVVTEAPDVRAGTSFGASGSLTGTLAMPSQANVLTGVGYGSSGLEFTGTATVPTAAQVLTGITYGAGGNALTGNITLPAANKVVSPTAFGPSAGTVGTVTLPTTAQVQAGVTFGAGGGSTGTITMPTAAQVLAPVTFGAGGATTGTVTLPAAAQVLSPIAFGPGSGTTGTITLPTAAQVLSPITFGAGGGTTGTVTLPAAAQVLSPVAFGPGGSSSGTYVVVATGNVRTGVTFGPAGGSTGTLALPSEANVAVGITYGSGGSEFTGTYAPAGGHTGVGNVRYGVDRGDGAIGTLVVPEQGYVSDGIGYGAGGTELTGILALPAQSQVQFGVGYGANGTEFTGSLSGSGGSTGPGDVPIDHSGGTGVTVDGGAAETDILRYVDPDGAGVPGLIIQAFLTSDFEADPPIRAALGITRTDSEGRWESPLMLFAGTYTLIADRNGDGFEPQVNTLVVP